MANYANQKRIIVNNDTINKVAHQREGPFLRAIDWKYIEAAQRILTGNEFTLLVYLLKWAGQGYCDFSPKDIEAHTKMTRNTIYKAFEVLCDMGYLEQTSSNTYTVDLFPPRAQIVSETLEASQ